MVNLSFNENTPREIYEELFGSEEGTVFGVEESDYETVMQRIEEYKPEGSDFEVFPINPGTQLYSTYGAGHCVVVKNTLE